MKRKIALVVRKVNMKNTNQSIEDLEYSLSKTPQERLSVRSLSAESPRMHNKKESSDSFIKQNAVYPLR